MTNLIIFLFYTIKQNGRIVVKIKIVLLIFLLSICANIKAEDSTLIRIQTDVDNVQLKINDSLYLLDNFSNKLTANNWFLITVAKGELHFVLKNQNEVIDTTIIISDQNVLALELRFLSQTIEDSLTVENKNNLFITSVPDSGFITINGTTLDVFTPSYLYVPDDSVIVEIYKDGYEPLVTDFLLLEFQKKQVEFILKPMVPAHLNADSLGYTMEKEIPPKDIRNADQIEDKYMGMAETFLIFPFAQGLVAKLALNDNNQTVANVMVGSGAILSAGSYLLSKILSKKKRNEIKAMNKEIEKQNIDIKSSNKEIELLVRSLNAERIMKWEDENVNKGVVKIKVDHD